MLESHRLKSRILYGDWAYKAQGPEATHWGEIPQPEGATNPGNKKNMHRSPSPKGGSEKEDPGKNV